MTCVRFGNEKRTVLDFTGDTDLSKNKIKEALRALQITTIGHTEDKGAHYIENQIRVGMYTVKIYPGVMEGFHSLKEFGDMFVQICETGSDVPISLKNDGRFKNQYWVKSGTSQASAQHIKINTLTDIIKYCYRLDKLKAFL